MNVIAGARGSGKTYKIVAMFQNAMVNHAQGGHLLVATAAIREDVINKYHLPPFMQQRVVVAYSGCLAGALGQVYVDNLDLVLSMLLGRAPEVGTLTGGVQIAEIN